VTTTQSIDFAWEFLESTDGSSPTYQTFDERLSLSADYFTVGVEYQFRLRAWMINTPEVESSLVFTVIKRATPLVAIIDYNGGEID
jgi:hypothetical protein